MERDIILRKDYGLEVTLNDQLPEEIHLKPRIFFFDKQFDFCLEDDTPYWFMLTEQKQIEKLKEIYKTLQMEFITARETVNVFFRCNGHWRIIVSKEFKPLEKQSINYLD